MSESEAEPLAGWRMVVAHEDRRAALVAAHRIAAHVILELPAGALVCVDDSEIADGRAHVCVSNEPEPALSDQMVTEAFEVSLEFAREDGAVLGAWDEGMDHLAIVESMLDSGTPAEPLARYIGSEMIRAIRERVPERGVDVLKRVGDKLKKLDANIFFTALMMAAAKRSGGSDESSDRLVN